MLKASYSDPMTDLIIRDLPERVHQGLSRRASENGRSPEDEARVVLEQQFPAQEASDRERGWLEAIAAIQDDLRAANGGELPQGVVDEFLAEKRLIAAAELAEVERYLSGGRISGGD